MKKPHVIFVLFHKQNSVAIIAIYSFHLSWYSHFTYDKKYSLNKKQKQMKHTFP